MALLHRATLQPSKLDLLTAYTNGGVSELVGSYRFDDPAGEVGIESHLARGEGGAVVHVPLTYRAEPLAGADEWLVGLIEHSVLGTRYVYNACIDPVYVRELVGAILTGGTQVEQYFETDAGREYREPTATVLGSGNEGTPVPEIVGVHAETFDADTVIDAGSVQVVVRHGLTSPEPDSADTLSGMWSGTDSSVVLAYLP